MEIKVYATLRSIVGGRVIEVDNSGQLTVEQMLEAMYAQFPALRPELYKGREELHPAIHILINGKDMRYLNGTDSEIKPDDDVRIFPPVGGGSR